MRPDLYFTEEEFIKFIEENVSDDDIRMMFENANLEKDVKNTFENFKGASFVFRQPIKQYKEKFVA